MNIVTIYSMSLHIYFDNVLLEAAIFKRVIGV